MVNMCAGGATTRWHSNLFINVLLSLPRGAASDAAWVAVPCSIACTAMSRPLASSCLDLYSGR